MYYDLLEEQQKNKRTDVALIRVEQLHPFPAKQVTELLGQFGKTAKVYWVQEEPENMGYWTYMMRVFGRGSLEVISRKLSASPATGYLKVHNAEQADLIQRAFA